MTTQKQDKIVKKITKEVEIISQLFVCVNCFKLASIPLVFQGSWFCSNTCFKHFVQSSMTLQGELMSKFTDDIKNSLGA